MELVKKNSDDILLEAQNAGFWALPPTIDEFLENTGFKSNLYEFWQDKLRDIYPDNIHVKENYIMFTGAIGTGKSTMSKIMALYNLTKLLFLKDLNSFRIAITKPIQFVFFHVKMEKARAEFVEFLEDFINTNLYMRHIATERKKLEREGKVSPMPFSFVTDGVRSNNAIGGDVIFYVFSEANFVKEEMIMYKIDQAYKRFKSRFILGMPYLGNIIIDTSSNYEGAISDVLNEKGDFYVVRASQWEVKPFAYFKKGHFYVFIGDGEHPPVIIKDEEEKEKYNPDKIIKVPAELEKEFRNDLYDALLSLAGINIKSPNTLFSIEIIEESFSGENIFGDIISVYELSRVGDFISRYFSRGQSYFVHVDTSIRGDYTGLAMASWKDGDIIEVPFAAGIHNDKKDIPMYLIEEFIRIISEKLFIEYITADTYQSYKLLQDIERKYKIKTKTISSDTNPTIYLTFKKMLLDRRLRIVKNRQLINELINLKITNTASGRLKIDHPTNGSKDIADAVACSVFMCMETGKKRININTEENEKRGLYDYSYINKVRSQIMYGRNAGFDIMRKMSNFNNNNNNST